MKTHFGYSQVDESEKAEKVAAVFDSVAGKYDLMNDLMSAGLHRIWKAFTVSTAALRPGMRALDIAGGTGDMALAFAKQVGPGGKVVLTDINASMLSVGRDRVLNAGIMLPCVQCDAEQLPFANQSFDLVCVAFGLRNMTHKEVALAEMSRVLAPGGKLMVLEFSKVDALLAPAYDVYSFKMLPWLGEKFAGDSESYRYLAESIRMHPDQQTLKTMMQNAGLERVRFHNLTGGVAALHVGYKL
jgi:demethylmenaquinone methyltransferase / 2-methoxy-6-polyprenyl-1,4-benzoquinol methylase